MDAASKLTDHVEESFTGREEQTTLYSMVPHYDKNKLDLVSVCSWLVTVEQSKDIEQVTTEVHGMAALTSGKFWQQPQRERNQQQWSSWQVEDEKIRTSTAPGAASMLPSIIGAFLFAEVHQNPRESHFFGGSRASGKHCFAILGCSVCQ